MPLIGTQNKTVQAYKGLHLYHFWLSSCSQRVRVVLAEKGLEWVSHPVDLSPAAMEHATEEFQSINPNGVVPVLVHDGQVIIESIDIIHYLDDNFPEPSLVASSDAGKVRMREWMQRADRAQHSLKTLTHEFLFKDGRMTPAQLEVFLEKHQNQELGDFMRVFCSEQGFPKSEIESELKIQHDEFVALDQALEGQNWLVENAFSLADIAWISNVRRFELMNYPLSLHPNLAAWYERFKQRPGYHSGISESEIPPALAHFAEYLKQRDAEGTGITSFSPLAG